MADSFAQGPRHAEAVHLVLYDGVCGLCSRPHAQTLDEIFGSGSWRTEVIGDGMDARLDRAIPLMARGIGAKWWTSAVRMVTGGQATRYVLLHLTNSDDGRDLMKECAWSVSPAGGFMVRRSDSPDQQFLIKPEPDRT